MGSGPLVLFRYLNVSDPAFVSVRLEKTLSLIVQVFPDVEVAVIVIVPPSILSEMVVLAASPVLPNSITLNHICPF